MNGLSDFDKMCVKNKPRALFHGGFVYSPFPKSVPFYIFYIKIPVLANFTPSVQNIDIIDYLSKFAPYMYISFY